MKKNLRLIECMAAWLLLLLLVSQQAAAQTPDSVNRKPSLPTGPPVPTEQPRPQQRPTVRPPVAQPPVMTPQARKQEDEQEKLAPIDRLYYGGSFGLQFGSYTNISLLPILGYKVTNRFSVGTGVVYHFIRSGGMSLNNYGGRAFTQVELFDIGDGALLAHAELEAISTESLYFDQQGYYTQRKMLALPMAGIGYRQRISDKASFDLLLLYNVNDDPANPYSNPVIRAGFNIPFRK
ncbi:hypothetical protein [Pontibacter liquoris]|uniref:hypothetical protein n=1 Tax=Pontibacter liquoris TaxID=2905677 RepID=UPI001FA7E89B|nr:hypothetical protein [Pontibacter liquoris]